MASTSKLFLGVFFSALSLFAALPAQAAPQRPYDAQAFKTAQDAGKPILIEVHADWCPTCKAQMPILDRLSSPKEFTELVRLRVDFDSQKDLVKSFGARMQSTLVLYKGGKEVARSAGETREDALRAMLAKAR